MKYVIYPNKYVDYPEALPVDSYKVGNTVEDYLQRDTWVLLSDAQVAFKEAHPSASVEEVISMQLKEPIVPPVIDFLKQAKESKLQEIDAQDKFSEKFFVSLLSGGVEVANKELWMDKDLRTSLMVSTLPAEQLYGTGNVTLWAPGTPSQKLVVPVAWALQKLPRLEYYAKQTYDLLQENRNKVDAATTLEQIAQIDCKKDYPNFLTFELNLDL